MRPLSEATARIAGKSFERKYIALGRIVKHWRDIVGAELADKAQPVRILYRKARKDKSGQKAKAEATLEIATNSAEATILHYQKELIIERINQIFGDRWVSAIKFVHRPSNSFALKRKKASVPLSMEEKNTLSSMLDSVEDHDIRARLESLGQAMLMDDKEKETL